MESISIFDIFKIGVGPSSSHTLGPWNAAREFSNLIDPDSFDTVEVHLFGSLAKTGKGHATDIAVQLGLEGHDPATYDTSKITNRIAEINAEKRLNVGGKWIEFDPSRHIIFQKEIQQDHPNTLIFKAYQDGMQILELSFYSIGGGFIEQKGGDGPTKPFVVLPYPIETAQDLIQYVDMHNLSIPEVVYANEEYFDPDGIELRMRGIFDAMLQSVYRGCTTEGILPGGLEVKRRAKALCDELLNGRNFTSILEWKKLIEESPREFNSINKWVSCFALAVNEENAALGRIVTSPTNGASGVIPAVLLYYYFFCDCTPEFDLKSFLCTSGEIGSLFKKGATISAAVGGCQAEIGVSSAMAAAGLTQVLGGSARQVLMAAEIAMEHHLGLTCDPVGGLVQIPCIERNAMGAMKAITACNLALSSDPEDSKVNLDVVIKTMWDTAQAMNEKYKETSEGGLAYNLPVIIPEC